MADGWDGRRLFALRQRLGSERRPLPMQALAEKLNAMTGGSTSASTLHRWETGQGEPDLSSARALAGLAGVSLYEFSFGTADPLTTNAAPAEGTASGFLPGGPGITAKRIPLPDEATGAGAAPAPGRKRGRAG